jgi:hypothetical protein
LLEQVEERAVATAKQVLERGERAGAAAAPFSGHGGL